MNKIIKKVTAIILVLCCILSAAGTLAPAFAGTVTYKYDPNTGLLTYYNSETGWTATRSCSYNQIQQVVKELQTEEMAATGGSVPSGYNNSDNSVDVALGEKFPAKSGKVKISYRGAYGTLIGGGDTVVYTNSVSSAVSGIMSLLKEVNYKAYFSSFTITLLDDVTESIYFEDNVSLTNVKNDITIDLNGNTWKAGGAGYCFAFIGATKSTTKSTIRFMSSKTGAQMVQGSGCLYSGEKYGGCILVKNDKLIVSGIEFVGSTAGESCYGGGAVAAFGEATTTIRNCTFTSLRAKERGAGVYACLSSSSYNLTISDSKFTSCKTIHTDGIGGAICLIDTNAQISDTEINACSANRAGGGIAAGSTSDSLYSLTVDGKSKIVSCTGYYGGGLCFDGLDGELKVFIEDNTVIQNCVGTYGGGIFTSEQVYTYLKDNACIQSCSAAKIDSAGGDGGAVCIAEKKTYYNSADATFNMAGNSCIKSCASGNKGSAVYVGAAGKCSFTDHSYVSSCSGDAIYVNGGIANFNSDGEFTALVKKASGIVSVSSGWFNKKVEYPASGLYATGAVSGDEHKTAPYTVTDKLLTLNFYGNNGSSTKVTYTDSPAGNVTMPQCSFTKTDCDFEGWRIGSPSGDLIQPGTILNVQANTDFYASWTPRSNAERTLTIVDPVSGAKHTVTTRSKTFKVEAYNSSLKRSNYYIMAYNTESDGSGTNIPIGSTIDFGNQLEATIYVVWKETLNIGEDAVNTVTFKDSYLNSKNSDFVFQSQNASIILMDNGFVKTGEVLAGWSTYPNGGGTVYQLGDSYTFSSQNDTLYAYWVDKSVNTYHAGASGQSQSEEIIIEIDPSASSGGAIEGGNGEVITARNIIFYDPTGQNKAVTLKTYDTTTLIYAGGFKRSGYTLKCWNTQANGMGTDYANGDEYTFGSDEKELDLYAMWTVNKNEVIEGEAGASQDIIDAYEKNGTLPDDWNAESGESGTISGIPDNWEEIYTDRPYYDVDSGKYYYDAVIWAEQVGAITGILGIDSDLFNGELACTRADLVTLLWEIAGEPEPQKSKAVFDDVQDGMYYSKAVCWANEQGIILGIGDNKMDPDGIVTRSQAMTVLWRYHGSPAPSGNTSFSDVEKGSWYEEAVLWGYEKQITLGTSATTFSPSATCSRGETVTFLFRDIVGVQ